MGIGRNIETGIAVAIARAIVVRIYEKERGEKEKPTDINL